MFISILYVFRAATRPSSGQLIVSIRHLLYVTLYRVTYTKCRIDTINSPTDGHVAAPDMW
jgi:hypothetical protein